MCIVGPAPAGRTAAFFEARLRPYFVLAYLVITSYSVVYQYGVRSLLLSHHITSIIDVGVPSSPLQALGILLVVVGSFLKLNWVSAWAFCVWKTHFARYDSPVTSPKRIMHSTAEEQELVCDFHQGPTNERLRKCGRCETRIGFGDRVYHCHLMDRHYAVYDHYCTWMWCAVYLETIKPYLLFMTYLAADCLFCLVASLFASLRAGSGPRYSHIGVAILSALPLVWYAIDNARLQFRLLALWNVTSIEYNMKEIVLVHQVTRRRQQLFEWVEFSPSSELEALRLWSPWSERTRMENFKQAMGEHWWSWPFWFLQPRRVRYYGRWPGRMSDLPLGELWRRFERDGPGPDSGAEILEAVPVARVARRRADRRSAGRSSGYEADVEV